jgi:hypothetical protein
MKEFADGTGESAGQLVCAHIFLGNAHHSVPMTRFFDSFGLSVEQVVCTPEDERPAMERHHDDSDIRFFFYRSYDHLFEFLKSLHEGSVFLLHGLFRAELRRKLLDNEDILRRCAWFGWGADFYPPQSTGLKGIWDQTKELLVGRQRKRRIARLCQQVIVCNDGDEEIMRRRMRAPRIRQLQYPLLGLSTGEAKSTSCGQEDQFRDQSGGAMVIMVGNSAAKSNEHEEIFRLISHLSEEDVHVWSPLGYGASNQHVERVLQSGREVFGEKFEGVTEMLAKSKYDDRLKSTDVIILGHRRQQGLYVAKCALFHGAYLFIRRQVTTYRKFASMGFSIGATEELPKLSFADLKSHEGTHKEKNRKLLTECYSEDALRPKFEQLIEQMLAEVESVSHGSGGLVAN